VFTTSLCRFLEDALRLLREYQLASVIRRLSGPRAADGGAPRSVLVKGGGYCLFKRKVIPDAYNVTLDGGFPAQGDPAGIEGPQTLV